MEKLPNLISVYDPNVELESRQIPLTVEENLTLVMDIKSSDIICDTQYLTGKNLNEFSNKLKKLSEEEFENALQITKNELMEVMYQYVPCVGCRKSIERLHSHLLEYKHPTLDPIIVLPKGIITIRLEKQMYNILGNIFNNNTRHLENLIETQPKRNKKSARCLLHSLESQRNRPISSVWLDVWNCMREECQKEVCIIEASVLRKTMDNYLRKHRFCSECKVKVLQAYSFLIEEHDRDKEQGYISSLYFGIRACIKERHIHLKETTEYITKLITKAEPELLGSRRERHAKTLEIAQEEVLTCLGIIIYERLHRVYLRVREEERTCQLFAAVSIQTLNRSFETAVEKVQGVSRLELCMKEFAREEQAKQKHKEAKKIRRKRRKEKIGIYCSSSNEHICCLTNGTAAASDAPAGGETAEERKTGCNKNDSTEKECLCSTSPEKENSIDEEDEDGCRSGTDDFADECDDCASSNASPSNKDTQNMNTLMDNCKNCDKEKEEENGFEYNKNHLKKELFPSMCKCEASGVYEINKFRRDADFTSEYSHDCGYVSENNNGCCDTGSVVSTCSSGGSSDVHSDTCCPSSLNRDGFDYLNCQCRLTTCGRGGMSLQEMLEVNREDNENCYITAEEVKEFKNNNRQVYEKRKELRELLQKKFAQFCVNGSVKMSSRVMHAATN